MCTYLHAQIHSDYLHTNIEVKTDNVYYIYIYCVCNNYDYFYGQYSLRIS